MITCWTDYPFVALGDAPAQKAPIRLVNVISYDGNKYAKVTFENNAMNVKAGYLYVQPGRLGQVEQIDLRNLAERLS